MFDPDGLMVASYRVLVVDDMATNRMLLRAALQSDDYAVTEAADGEQALALLAGDESFDVVLLDVNLPGLNGFEVCRRIRASHDMRLLPVIMLTTLEDPTDVVAGMQAGASDYLIKPFQAIELKARLAAAAEHKRLIDRLDEAEAVLFALARMVEAKDETTGDHCDRLAHTGVVFGRALGLSYEELEALRRGGVLHDIGKLGIPDSILCKKGPLDAAEWKIMKQHNAIGAALCSPLKTMRRTADIVLCHHEKWNGAGYPAGLAGDEIPLLARVFQIVDIYDALSSDRPYKPAWPREKIIATMQAETEKGFWDPRLTKVFLDILKTQPEVLTLSTGTKLKQDQRIFQEIEQSGALAWSQGGNG